MKNPNLFKPQTIIPLGEVKTEHPDAGSSQKSYQWKVTFIIVLLPFLVCGFPSHLTFRKRKVQSTREWLKILCPLSAPCYSLLTILMVIITCVFNISTIYMLGDFLKILVVTVDFHWHFFELAKNIVIALPLLVPINLFWIKGFRLRNCIISFDRFTEYVTLLIPKGYNPIQIPKYHGKLISIYLCIILVHTLHIIIDTSTDSTLNYVSTLSIFDQVWYLIFGYSSVILYTLTLPVYCTFCWAIDYQLKIMFQFLNSLMTHETPPDFRIFDELKKCYRKVADDIMYINQLCSLFVSVVITILMCYLVVEVKNLVMFAVSVVLSFLEDENAQLQVQPSEIRLLVGNTLIVLLYFAIFGFTYWQAVVANDSVRYFHVWLNDFVTEPEARLSRELYEGFTLLKWYVHSRLEQERPALLGILLFSIIPCTNTRLRQYKVFH